MSDRIPLTGSGEMHDEPFTTGADYIKSQQDKSHMPWPEQESRNTSSTPSRQGRSSKRQPNTRRRKQGRRQSKRQQADSGPVSQRKKEEAAVKHLVRKLQEKGVSESFIRENMEDIRERARKEILDT